MSNDETYTLDELNRAYTDLMGNFGTGGTSGEKFLDRITLQVRKNRVFDVADKPLLVQVRDLIRDNPSRHDQRSWVGNAFGDALEATLGELRQYATSGPVPDEPENPDAPMCGTTACVAGWAVILAGDPKDQLVLGSDWRGNAVVREIRDSATGNLVDFETRGAELLGLKPEQAGWLFEGGRTRDEVLSALDALIENPSAELWDAELDGGG